MSAMSNALSGLSNNLLGSNLSSAITDMSNDYLGKETTSFIASNGGSILDGITGMFGMGKTTQLNPVPLANNNSFISFSNVWMYIILAGIAVLLFVMLR